MNQQTPTEYLKNKEMRTYTPFTYVGGQGYYILKGHYFTEKEFTEMFPLAAVVRQKKQMTRENIDSSKSYLN